MIGPIPDKGPIIDGEELRVGDRVESKGGMGKGAIARIDGDLPFPFLVDHDAGDRAWYARSGLRRVYYDRKEKTPMTTSEEIKLAFSVETRPDMGTIEKAFEAVVFRLNEQRVWADRVRHLVKNSPNGINVNDLLALSNALGKIEDLIVEDEELFRERMRLAMHNHVEEML